MLSVGLDPLVAFVLLDSRLALVVVAYLIV